MIKLLKKSLSLILCTICSVCFAQGSLKFNPSTLDFGSVYKDIKYEKNVLVTNNTTSALSITKVINTAESMIKIEYPTSPIEAGESVNVKITFLCPNVGFPGSFKKIITFGTSDGGHARLHVIGELSFEPAPKVRKGNLYITYNNKKYGVENLNGRTILKQEYDRIDVLPAGFITQKGNECISYDLNGKRHWGVVSEREFSYYFDNIKVSQYGYDAIYDINTGKCILPSSNKCRVYEKNSNDDFDKGIPEYRRVLIGENQGGFINTDGHEVFRFKFNTSPLLEKEVNYKPYYHKGKFFVVVNYTIHKDDKIGFYTEIIDINGNAIYKMMPKSYPRLNDNGELIADLFIDDKGKIAEFLVKNDSFNIISASESKPSKEVKFDINKIPNSKNPFLK